MEDRIIIAFEHAMAGELEEAQALVTVLKDEAPENEEVLELAAYVEDLQKGDDAPDVQTLAGMGGDGILPGQGIGAGPSTVDSVDDSEE